MKRLLSFFVLPLFALTLSAQNPATPQTTDVVVLVENLNTPTNSQFSLSWYRGSLLFSSDRSSPRGSRRPGTPSLFYADAVLDFQQGTITSWNPVVQLRTGRSSDPDRAFAFNPNTNTYYVMHCPAPRRGTQQTCNIFAYRVDERGRVSRPAQQSFHDDQAVIGHPSLSSDGNIIFFSVRRAGRTNLYMARLTGNNTWSTPVMLPEVINTASDDTHPQLFRDSLLFFASNGHPGLGGMDIFFTRILLDGETHAISGSSDLAQLTFSEPVNLGAPINSSADDFSMLMQHDGNGGFFISNRAVGGANRANIFRINQEPQVFEQAGIFLANRGPGAAEARGPLRIDMPIDELLVLLENELPDFIRIIDTVFVETPVYRDVPVAEGATQAVLQQKNAEIAQLREDLYLTRDELRACFATANQIFHAPGATPPPAQAAAQQPPTARPPQAAAQQPPAARPAQPAAQQPPAARPGQPAPAAQQPAARPAAQPPAQAAQQPPAARPAAAQPAAQQGRVVYRIQLAASRTPDFRGRFDELYRAMPNLRLEVITHTPFDGYYRYVTVPFATFAEADAVRRRIQALGFECFVSGYRGNQRVSMSVR